MGRKDYFKKGIFIRIYLARGWFMRRKIYRYIYNFLLPSFIMGGIIWASGCFSPQTSQKNVITVWHWMSDRQSTFEELAKKYEQETGIKVHFELFFPPGAYSQKIQAAAAARDLPDLFGILGEKRIIASFIKQGNIEDLTPYMEENQGEWEKRFIDISLKFNSFAEGNIYGVKPMIYAVPIDTMNIQFLFNKSLLKKIGFDTPPSNWNEFLKMGESAKDIPHTYGFVCGWGETWFLYCLVSNYAFNIMGKDKFFATLRGEIPYTDPDWIRIFSLFQEMKERGILAVGIVTMTNKEAEQLFANNRALFSFNGSWGVNTYRQMNPDLQYDTMMPPPVSDKYSPRIWAGAGSSFMVNANSPRKKEAVQFLKWLTEKEQQIFLIERTHNLPSIKGCEDKIDSSLRRFLKNMENTTHPNLWPINESSRVIEAINTGIQKILIGEKTPLEVAKEVQKVKESTLKEK